MTSAGKDENLSPSNNEKADDDRMMTVVSLLETFFSKDGTIVKKVVPRSI
jgi:hypothetical protein